MVGKRRYAGLPDQFECPGNQSAPRIYCFAKGGILPSKVLKVQPFGYEMAHFDKKILNLPCQTKTGGFIRVSLIGIPISYNA